MPHLTLVRPDMGLDEIIANIAIPHLVPPPVVVGSRAMNVSLALLVLVLTSPLILLIALAVKLTSDGPVLYVQERVGLDGRGGRDRRQARSSDGDPRRARDLGGKLFRMYKFRTMRIDAERESGAVWATEGDPRVTSIGRFLRRYRLDELPQLVNVLRGEMNIVGPRPERPTIFADLRLQIPEYHFRQRAKPGITGLAQINHHYDRSVDDVRIKLGYDLDYIGRHSTREDLRIMIRTVPAVILKRRGW
ncbi:MAG: sugar transferase [Chloroflexi bacterium]|nr:sugar transferase [Chloroflexota bacterium]